MSDYRLLLDTERKNSIGVASQVAQQGLQKIGWSITISRTALILKSGSLRSIKDVVGVWVSEWSKAGIGMSSLHANVQSECTSLVEEKYIAPVINHHNICQTQIKSVWQM